MHVLVTYAVTAGALVLDNTGPPHRSITDPAVTDGLVVAWNDNSDGTGSTGAMSLTSPWAFQTPTVTVGRAAVVRSFEGRVYVVEPEDGTITVIDADTWTPVRAYALGADSAPQDIAVVSADRAYVTRSSATHLLRLHLDTGTTDEVVDLAGFADADGVPDMAMMATHECRLFVQLRRHNDQAVGFVRPALLAVVDMASEQLIDVDATMPGTQAIELEGTAPKLKMQVIPQTRRLFVSATGESFDDGGLEMIDLDALRSLGLVVRESDNEVGVDLGAFVMVGPDRGYLTFTTDLVASSHLRSFTLAGGPAPGPDLHTVVGYIAQALAFDPANNHLFLPEPDGVHVFDTLSDARLTTHPVAVSGVPTDLELLGANTVDCADAVSVPAASAWGVMAMLLALVTAASAVLVRRARLRTE